MIGLKRIKSLIFFIYLFFLPGDKYKPKLHLRPSGLTYSACEPFISV